MKIGWLCGQIKITCFSKKISLSLSIYLSPHFSALAACGHVDPLLPDLDFSRAVTNLEFEVKSSDLKKNLSSLKIITPTTTVCKTKRISLLAGNDTQGVYMSPSLCVHTDSCQLTLMYYFSLSSTLQMIYLHVLNPAKDIE